MAKFVATILAIGQMLSDRSVSESDHLLVRIGRKCVVDKGAISVEPGIDPTP